MSKSVRMPSGGSILDTAASFAGSGNRAIWLGLVTGPGASGSVLFWHGTASATGSHFLHLIAGSRTTQVEGPFILPNGVIASPTGGSAIYWTE